MPFDWPSATGFYFSRARAGGGVLLDEGVHLLDCLLDWFGPVSAFQYQDDNLGSGIEANVVLSLRHQWGGGEVPGRVRLSRMYALKNRLVVRGAKARAVILRNDPAVVVLHTDLAGKEVTMTLRLPEDSPSKQKDPFGAMLEDFVQSIRTGQKPAVDGWKALETIQLMERCYQEAQRIPEPWFEITSMERNLNR
jgi:predicted dehydrogenase